jgi:DHA2 family multidrug resistance protein
LSASSSSPDQVAAPGAGHRIAWSVVICAIVANLAYSIMWNSVVVALPHMQGEFAATTDQITWVMIAYILGSAMITAVVGWISGRYGRRRVFLIALATFCVTLVGCGTATTLEEMVAWRFLQGLSGAPLVPLTQVLVVNAFPPGRMGQATSLWAIGFVAGNVISPTLAGYIIEWAGWEWIFFVILPFAFMALLWATAVVPDTDPTDEKLDWFGFLTLAFGVGALQIGLARGERMGWFESPEVMIEMGLAILLLYWFLTHTLTRRNTFIDKGLFKGLNFPLGLTFVFMIGLVLYLPMIFLPLMLRDIGGYPADAIGELLFARGIGTILSLSLMAYLRDRVNLKILMLFGLVMAAVPTWIMARWAVDVDPGQVFLANFLHGLATGFIWAPMTKMTLDGLSGPRQDKGYALFYLVFDLGNAIGTAFFVTLWTHSVAINRTWIAEAVSPFRDVWRGEPMLDPSGLPALADELTRQATVIAFNNGYFAMGAILIALLPLILLFRGGGARDPD